MGSSTAKGNTNGNRPTRAVALVGPAGTGKTSLAEALLFASGAINRQGSVESGTTVGDASPEARARRGSTEINLMHFDYLGDRFALIDMPGGAGFAADRLAALQSADLALVVIDPAPERAPLRQWMITCLSRGILSRLSITSPIGICSPPIWQTSTSCASRTSISLKSAFLSFNAFNSATVISFIFYIGSGLKFNIRVSCLRFLLLLQLGRQPAEESVAAKA